jgi:hypothetical protein
VNFCNFAISSSLTEGFAREVEFNISFYFKS